MTTLPLLQTLDELKFVLQKWRGAKKTLGFIPTMGNLHAGHLSLVKRAQAQCDRTLVSIFVNPLQFGPQEDLARYPRTLENDLRQLTAIGADAVFFPSVEMVYPRDLNTMTFVEVPAISNELCGAFRPGHFRGVATVVAKLFHWVQPKAAFFGEKDFQQCVVIQRMVEDLNFAIEIVTVPTLRDERGLALSSRNQYLTETERQSVNIYETLCWLRDQLIKSPPQDVECLLQEASQRLIKNNLQPQYVENRRASDLQHPTTTDRERVLLIAAYKGQTRLIDNLRYTL